ncbi:hypothetical protein MTO96_019499 [Rhipicephalus appendiculatus]
MSSISGAACVLRDEGFFRDRRVLRAEARRRHKRFTLLGARRRIAVVNEAPETAAEDSDDGAAPFTSASRVRCRPPPDYASFRERHRRYYDSIRHTFISNASSTSTCADRHANCKASHAASKHSERPPWDDSTKLSFAPEGFQFLPPVKRTTTRATAKAKRGENAKDEANIASASGVETVAEPEENARLLDFSFLFKPYSFFLRSPTKKVNKTKEKASAKKGVLASVGNVGLVSQDTKLGGSRRRHLASKENTPAVESRSSAKSNASSKQKQSNLRSSPADKENVKSGYNLRPAKLSSALN